MKIAIPTDEDKGLESKASEHFGRCIYYTFIDGSGNFIEALENTSSHMGGSKLPPEIMKENGADVLICKGLGPKAIQLCSQLGIDVYVCSEDTAKCMFELFNSGKLEKASLDDGCKDHKH